MSLRFKESLNWNISFIHQNISITIDIFSSFHWLNSPFSSLCHDKFPIRLFNGVKSYSEFKFSRHCLWSSGYKSCASTILWECKISDNGNFSSALNRRRLKIPISINTLNFSTYNKLPVYSSQGADRPLVEFLVA